MIKYATDWLEQYSVSPPSKGAQEIGHEFRKLLDEHPGDEEGLQKFLAENPFILSQLLPHCHHVIPKQRLGSQYVTDFVLPEMSSGGTFWYLVEIEPANVLLTTKDRVYGKRVRTGLQQLRDWRTWVNSNREYVKNPRPNGLGFDNVEGISCMLIVGRRHEISDRFNQLRQQTWDNDRIEIKTFDGILDFYMKRAEFWDAHWQSLRRMASE